MMETTHVVIKESAFCDYTGVMYGSYFKDGKTVEPMLHRDAVRLAAIMDVETIDGNDLNPLETEIRVRKVMNADDAKAHEAGIEADIQTTLKKPVVPTSAATPDVPVYSRDELEAIADSEGIRGLRELANGLGVKGRSIEEIIGEILDLQGGK